MFSRSTLTAPTVPAAAPVEQYWSLATAFTSESKSFEEVRTEDYLKAYTNTGRPPAPYPATDHERVMLKLPPPFVPHTIPSTPIARFQDLPPAQTFFPTPAGEERMYSISADAPYSPYSFEELRTYAYLAGNKAPAKNIPHEPFNIPPASSSLSSSTRIASSGLASAVDPTEKFQSISADPAYSGHSFEEHRVNYLQKGRELTSAELNGGTRTTGTTNPLVSNPTVPTFGGAPVVPQQQPVTVPFGQAPPQQPSGLFASTGSGFGRSMTSTTTTNAVPTAPAAPAAGTGTGTNSMWGTSTLTTPATTFRF